jgi:hypothetical protein
LLPAEVITEPLQPHHKTAASATTEALVSTHLTCENPQLCAEHTITLHRASVAPIGGYTRGGNLLVDHAL